MQISRVQWRGGFSTAKEKKMAFLIVKGLLLLLGIKWVTKACNSLSSRFARGKQESCMYTHMYHHARESPLKSFPCYLLPSASLRIGTTPREILDVLWHFPRQIFLKLEWIFLFVGISCWVFLQCPPAALGSRLESRFKLLQVQRCHRVQYTCSPAQLGDTL